MGRELTGSEARVLAVLLGTGGEPEKVRIERSGAPRSTYVTTRRRAYDQRWVRDRYLPSPDLGFRSATFALARPFLEHRDELERRWTERTGNVLLWKWPEHLFGVFLEREVRPASSKGISTAPSDLVPADTGRSVLEMRCDLTRPQVPVYFDFEGAWANLLDIPRGQGYPRAWGTGEGTAPLPSPGLQKVAAALLARPFDERPAEEPSPRRFHGPGGLPRSQRRLLQKGWAEWRVLPDLREIPPYEGKRIRRIVLVHGEMRLGRSMEDLYHDLWDEGETAPFLLAGDGRQVLLGMLGTGGGEGVGPEGARPGGVAGGRRAVSSILSEHLDGIESVSAPVDETSTPVDHRYDRLFPPT